MQQEHPWMNGPPDSVLLATDLSVRCDRALDRAAQLAGEWRAQLLALNVLESHRSPDLVLGWVDGDDDAQLQRFALQQLQSDVAGLDVPVSLRLVRDDPVAGITRVARESGSGLVVTGVASDDLWGRLLLGSTVESLARRLPQPLLVVRKRVRHAYRRILVATDFSDCSRHALNAAAAFFPGGELLLYHAFDPPLSGLAGTTGSPAAASRLEQAGQQFLARCELPEAVRQGIRLVVEEGALGQSLSGYVRERQIDLVCMGSQGRSGLLNILLGSSAAELLGWLPCDALIVREPQA